MFKWRPRNISLALSIHPCCDSPADGLWVNVAHHSLVLGGQPCSSSLTLVLPSDFYFCGRCFWIGVKISKSMRLFFCNCQLWVFPIMHGLHPLDRHSAGWMGPSAVGLAHGDEMPLGCELFKPRAPAVPTSHFACTAGTQGLACFPKISFLNEILYHFQQVYSCLIIKHSFDKSISCIFLLFVICTKKKNL